MVSLDVTRLHSYLYTHFAGLVRLGYGLVTRDVVSSSLERVLEQAGLTEVELDRSSDVVEAEHIPDVISRPAMMKNS